MPQLLPVFRAARLAGVSRQTLQKKIHDGELATFEGMIAPEDLIRLYPQINLTKDTEFERVSRIKQQAFARRVRERLLPDAEVLARRLNDVGHELAQAQTRLRQHQVMFDMIRQRLDDIKDSSGNESPEDIHDLSEWIQQTLGQLEQINLAEEEKLLAHNTVLRIMAAHIKIKPSNHEFWLEGNDTLLDAGIHSGLALNYGCASGNCGLCKARVVEGEVKKIRHHDYVLSEAEKLQNYVLLCSCTAVSDVTLEALEASSVDDIPLQEITTKVKNTDLSHPDIFILHLQTPRTQRLRFLAGQSVTLTIDNHQQLHLPIASCPCDDRNLLFHIPRNTDNTVISNLTSSIAKGDSVNISGPFGEFIFQEDSQRPVIFLAFDTGFAPIKSLIEHAMALEHSGSLSLYWATENEQTRYAHNLCRSWADALEDFHYFPVDNTDPLAVLLENHQTLEKFDVYVAGPESAVTKSSEALCDAGLPNGQLNTFIEG